MKSGYAFSGNPVIFSQGEFLGFKRGTFRVLLGYNVIYEGQFNLPVSLNIAEIIDAEISAVGNPNFPQDRWLHKTISLSDLSGPQIMTLSMEYDGGGDEECRPIRMLKGRIPLQRYGQLTFADTDIFTERFLNPEANFFLTNRTESSRIDIPETELYPLCFVAREGKKIKVEAGEISFVSDALEAGVYWLSLENIRKKIFMDSECADLVNVFYIGYTDCAARVRVVITKGEEAINRIRIRYRNSFDVPDLIAFDGELTVKPVAEETEDSEYLQYSSYIDDFTTKREEQRQMLQLTLDTGPVLPKDLPRLVELMASRDVTLESPADGSFISVIPSAENLEFPLRPEAPVSFTITLKVAIEDLSLLSLLTPDTNDPLRLFSEEHNDKFN